jgi:hypothetical protein
VNNQQLAAFARISAINARVAGMQAADATSIAQGYSGVYSEGHYQGEAWDLSQIAEELMKQEQPQ